MENTAVKKKKKKSTKTSRLVLKLSSGFLQLAANVAFYILVAVAITQIAKYSYDFAYRVFGNETMEEGSGTEVKLTILKDETSMNVASKLELNKLINDKYSFYVKAKLSKSNIMPGTFILNTSMTYSEILDTITDYSKSVSNKEKSVSDLEYSP